MNLIKYENICYLNAANVKIVRFTASLVLNVAKIMSGLYKAIN